MKSTAMTTKKQDPSQITLPAVVVAVAVVDVAVVDVGAAAVAVAVVVATVACHCSNSMKAILM